MHELLKKHYKSLLHTVIVLPFFLSVISIAFSGFSISQFIDLLEIMPFFDALNLEVDLARIGMFFLCCFLIAFGELVGFWWRDELVGQGYDKNFIKRYQWKNKEIKLLDTRT